MKHWVRIVVAAGFVPAFAFAQAASPAPEKKTVGRPHHCEAYVPDDLKSSGAKGETTLAFTVTVEGWVRNIEIAQSSGNAELDGASVTCASHWHYLPATQDGAPVAMPWQAKVVWAVPPAPPDTPQDQQTAAPKP